MPDSKLYEPAKVKDVRRGEDVGLAGLKRTFVRLAISEAQLAGVAVFTEQYDEDVCVGSGATHVARFHRYSVRRRFHNNNKSTQAAQTSANAKILNKIDPGFESRFSD